MRATRIIEVDGLSLVLPPYITRVHRGWQVRVGRTSGSAYFSDSNYGGSEASLREAVLEQKEMLASENRMGVDQA